MKLYNSIGSKPRSVSMFVAEKGIEVPPEEVDPLGGENRGKPCLSKSKNSGGTMLVLERNDGRVRSEVTTACMTLADILLFSCLDFAATAGQGLEPANGDTARVIDRTKARLGTA